MRYAPFDKDIKDVDPSELQSLKEVHEGWYVEYKSQLVKPQSLAKSLASFANQFGGWLFLGIDQDKHTGTAGGFPGISNEELPQVLESLRNAAKDIIRPVVEYRERIFPGPIESIGIDSNHFLLAIYVPEGPNTPYVHNDGRIYIRIGDSSSPDHAKDRATFDLLFRRGEDKRQLLKLQTDRTPKLSDIEGEHSYLHLSIQSDPYATLGHRYTASFTEFSEMMKKGFLPFDNTFATLDGFVARQVENNHRYLRLLTWELSRDGHSFVTVPMMRLSCSTSAGTTKAAGHAGLVPGSETAKKFCRIVNQNGLSDCPILDLIQLAPIVMAVFRRHRTIMGQANISGPLHTKARIVNVWRTIPFIDLPEYIEHVEKHDIPLIQWNEFEWPPAWHMNPCFVIPEWDSVPEEPEPGSDQGPVNLWLRVMEALGIPWDFLAANATVLWRSSRQRMKDEVGPKNWTTSKGI